jgi:hypothetical protein
MRRFSCCTCPTLGGLLVTALPALAHVALDSPNGGQSLTSGATFQIQYNPEIAHGDTINYELQYSVSGASGPWINIASNIAVDPTRNSDGAANFFAWGVPNVNTDNAFVRVFQNNPGTNDYEDHSTAAFTIVPALPGDYSASGRVDSADYTTYRDTLGSTTNLAANGDNAGASRGRIDAADLAFWRSRFNATSAVASATAVPEPRAVAITLLLILSRIPTPFDPNKTARGSA